SARNVRPARAASRRVCGIGRDRVSTPGAGSTGPNVTRRTSCPRAAKAALRPVTWTDRPFPTPAIPIARSRPRSPPHVPDVAPPQLEGERAPQAGAPRELRVGIGPPGGQRGGPHEPVHACSRPEPLADARRDLAQPPRLRGGEPQLVAAQADAL